MARRQRSAKRFLLLSTLAVFATVALAQTTNEDAATATTDAVTSAKTTATGATTAGSTTTKATSATGTSTTAASTTKATTATGGTTTTVPNLSSTSSTTSTGTNTAATVPTLSSASNTAANTYPAASVPPTNNAPFMQQSSVPEGTVFIAVGAILGACGAAVLVWRAVVACLLHRSVKRAALAQHMANDKMAIPGAPPPNFYKYTDHESQGSFGHAAGHAAAAGGRGVRRTTRGPIPSATPSQTNLFFSPTAGGTGGGAGNRSSTFLPSGFYAAGQGNPQSQGHSHNISMTNLRPESMAASRTLGHTPPESPGLTPHNGPVRGHPQMSTSSLNLNQPPTGRAPSAYLQDLLDEDPNQFPPAHSQTWAQPHSHDNNNNNRI